MPTKSSSSIARRFSLADPARRITPRSQPSWRWVATSMFSSTVKPHEQARQLERAPDAELEHPVGRRVGDLGAAEAHLTLLDPFVPGDDVEQRCLASKVPKLCATDSLAAYGSCRLCVVEIEGRKGYPASCTTPVEAGMKVRTQTPHVAELRRNVMELYMSDHPLDCLTCTANGNCELQDMAGVVGLRHVRYGYAGKNHLDSGRMSPIPISPSIRPNASCARDACARATRCRAPSP